MAAGSIQDKKPNMRLAMALPLVCGVRLCGVTGGHETATEGGGGEVSGRPQEGQNWLVSATEAPQVPQNMVHLPREQVPNRITALRLEVNSQFGFLDRGVLRLLAFA